MVIIKIVTSGNLDDGWWSRMGNILEVYSNIKSSKRLLYNGIMNHETPGSAQ